MRSKSFLPSAFFFLAAASAFSFAACGGNVVLDSGPCGNGKKSCNGVCVDVTSDLQNCGACGNVCGDELGCVNGKCGGGVGGSGVGGTTQGGAYPDGGSIGEGGSDPCASLPGTSYCPDGCFDLNTDVMHCGSCYSACGQNDVCDGGQCLSEGCVTCGAFITDGIGTLCPTSQDLYNVLIDCVCAGACIAACQDNVCAGQNVTTECQNCVLDTAKGCGQAFNDCSNDI